MANLLDYLDWRGDLSLTERSFNEVDNLVLVELVYARMTDIVPDWEGEPVPLSEVAKGYRELGYESHIINNPDPLLQKAAESERFSGVRLAGYVDEVNRQEEMQFSAVTFLLPDDTVYVAYRGTDDTVVGWREDFNFSFMKTQGQLKAVTYLEEAARRWPGSLRVGGHSKGGNLAVYASAFCADDVKARILNVYSNDGPGFNGEIVESEAYRNMLEKVMLIIPETSIVGILMSNKSERVVVKSDAIGAMQHNPLTWQLKGTHFEVVDSQSPASLFMDDTLSMWLDMLSGEEKAEFVRTIFDSIDASGAKTLTEVNENWQTTYAAILRAFVQIDPERRKDINEILKKLRFAGREVLAVNVRESLEHMAEKAAEKAADRTPLISRLRSRENGDQET